MASWAECTEYRFPTIRAWWWVPENHPCRMLSVGGGGSVADHLLEHGMCGTDALSGDGAAHGGGALLTDIVTPFPGAEDPGPKPRGGWKFTPKRRADYLELLRAGGRRGAAARSLGLSRSIVLWHMR